MSLLSFVGRGLVSTVSSSLRPSTGAIATACRAFASDASLSKKDVMHFLDCRDDPEVDQKLKAYMRAAYSSGKETPEKPEETYKLAAAVERKYIAAQTVESGLHNIGVPLAWEKEGLTGVKRYLAQLQGLSAKAGFEDPAVAMQRHVSETAQTASSVKELLSSLESCTTPEFYSSLMEAAASVEAEMGPISLDGKSPAYKKFADKVKAIRDVPSSVEAGRMMDAMLEIKTLQSEATALLDRHLSKGAEQIRKEQAAALQAMHKRIEANKGSAWAEQYKKDLEALAAYDAGVAADPINGPKVAVA